MSVESSTFSPRASIILFFFLFSTLSISYSKVAHKRAADSCLENIPGIDPVYRVNDSKYCKCCDAGLYKKYDCIVNGGNASCMPCEAGHYSNTPNQAIQCSLCSYPPKCRRPNMEITQNCSRMTNFDCRCKAGYYFKPRQGSNGDGDCVKHTTCPQGTYIEWKGTSESDTECRSCGYTPNTNSDEYNKSCSNSGKQQECDPTTNATCPDEMKEATEEQIKDYIYGVIAAVAVIVVLITTAIAFYLLRRCEVFDIISYCKKDRHKRCSNGHDNGSSRYTERPSTDEQSGIGRQCRTIVNLEIPTTEVIPQLQRSPVDGNFDYAEICAPVSSKADVRKQWLACLRWTSNNINILSWKFVIRCLIGQIDHSDSDPENIIQEVGANYQGNVREQIYNALLKWYQIRGPNKVDLNCICDALEEHGEGNLSQKLQERYPDLVKSNSRNECVYRSFPDDTLNPDTSSVFAKSFDKSLPEDVGYELYTV